MGSKAQRQNQHVKRLERKNPSVPSQRSKYREN